MRETEVVWPEATERLRRDPAFGPLVERVGPVRLRPPRGTPFASLAAAIVYQQLAGAAAATIHGRFVEAVVGHAPGGPGGDGGDGGSAGDGGDADVGGDADDGGDAGDADVAGDRRDPGDGVPRSGTGVTAAAVLATPEEALRGAGLSRAKATAIRDLAEKSRSGEVPLGDLAELDDDAVVRRLTRVRGIGPWTAHMFLLFDLRRPDVWPTGDLGVRAGLGRVLGLEEPPTPEQTAWAGVGYRPWRSAVAWYCWRAAE